MGADGPSGPGPVAARRTQAPWPGGRDDYNPRKAGRPGRFVEGRPGPGVRHPSLEGSTEPMGSFAWRNLLTRPLRTALALVGLSIPILGVMGLFSVSRGLRNMVGDTLSRVEGLMVLRENSPSPVFSDLEANLGEKIRAIPG